jgi:PPOX class probable F420-dependent enzyme
MTVSDATAPSSPTLSAEARRFLEAPRFAVIATINPDGSPLQAVVWFRLDGDTIVFNSRVGRRWPSNLARDRRVSVTVSDGYNYVDLRGEVDIDNDPAMGQTVIADLSRRYRRSKAEAEAEIVGFATQRRVTFRLRPSRIFERLPGE